MDIEQLKYYIAKIQTAPIEEIDNDEFVQFTIKVIEHNNQKNNRDNSGHLELQEYLYLQIFFHKYACKINENQVEYTFVSETEINELRRRNPNRSYSYNDSYSFAENKVQYVKSPKHVFVDPTTWNIFHCMHENRHAKQKQFFSMGERDVLKLDPLAIAIMKEYLAIGHGAESLYNQTNHRNFVMENDASLYADIIIRDFITKNCGNSTKLLRDLDIVCQFEKNNYASIIQNKLSLVDIEFREAPNGTLPMFYEIDRFVKQIPITKEMLEKFPILGFIYHSNGKAKTYQELMEDKERIKQQHNGATVQINMGYQTKELNASTHIENLYDIIIKTDPCLQIEHYLYCGKYHQVSELLTECPQLIKLYEKQIFDLYYKYLTVENYSKIYPLVTALGNLAMITKIENRYNYLIIQRIEKTFGIKVTSYWPGEDEKLKTKEELDEEEVQIYNQIEQKISNKSLSEKIGREYQKIIHHRYSQFRTQLENHLREIASQEDIVNQVETHIYEGKKKK